MPMVNKASFKKVSEKGKEVIEALAPFCRNDMYLVNTSGTPDPDSTAFLGRQIKPDISCYSKPAPPRSCITRARDMETFIELKNREIDEPYCDLVNKPFEHDTKDSRDTRGQLASYLNAIQATQNRTHTFGVFINRDLCRLLHHTRSCTVVTKLFNYTNSTHLQKFFWLFTHADAAARGHDGTFEAIEADSDEALKAHSALGLSVSAPLFKLFITDDLRNTTTSYIVSRPFANNDIFPVGRGTRCYEAYDCQSHQVVLLKDTWRVEGYLPEGIVYRRLHEARVSHIAGLIAAGDVHGPTHKCGNTGNIKARAIGSCIRRHIHYRLVLDTVGSSLTHFSSTWELVNAVKCALISHQEAATKATILHRDISVGNILITRDGNGILIDWELCKDLSETTEARVKERTGTWQFISVRLLNGTATVHRVGDDLESFIHVLAWVAARHAPNSMDVVKRGEFLRVFDATIQDTERKARLLSNDIPTIRNIKILQPRFEKLMCDLWHGFACRYDSYFVITQDDNVACELQERLETHDWMLTSMKDALQEKDWQSASDDGAVLHEIPEPDDDLTEAQRKRRKSNLSEYI